MSHHYTLLKLEILHCLISPLQRLHTNWRSTLSLPEIPLHFLWTQCLQLWQNMELLPTPFLQTPHGHFPTPKPLLASLLLIITLVFAAFTLNLLSSRPVFHFSNFPTNSSIASAIRTRSSAYSSSHGHPVLNSIDKASKTMINNKGLSTEPDGHQPSHWILHWENH